MVCRMPFSSMKRMSKTSMPSSWTKRFSPASTLRMPIWRMSCGDRAGLWPPMPVSSVGPWPHRQATGMPCRLPEGVSVAVLRSAWASSQSTRRRRPVSRQWRATALMLPMAKLWSPPSISGSRPARSSARVASCSNWFQRATSARCRKPPTAGCSGLSGPWRSPQSRTSMPKSATAWTMPATRKALGPMRAPMRPAPTSVGAPIRLTARGGLMGLWGLMRLALGRWRARATARTGPSGRPARASAPACAAGPAAGRSLA